MLYRAYVDESSDNPQTNFTVGGFVGTADSWKELEPKWLAAIPPGISYFHATDCFGGRKLFRGITMQHRVQLLDTLIDLILSVDAKLLKYRIDVEAYRAFAPKLRQNDFGTNQYAAPLSFLVQTACRDYITSRHPFTPYPEKTDDLCEFFLEDGHWRPSAQRAIQEARTFYLDAWWNNRVGPDAYGKMAPEVNGAAPVIPLLQVADFGAFLANKVLTDAPDGPIPWRPYYEKICAARRICFQLETISAKALKKFYAIHSAIKLEAEGIDVWDEV